jgi:16S rRNA (guanine527-N7)-methyltransferase
VSETTLEDLPLRHFVDSAQLIKYIPEKKTRLADLGSGAGFPGFVLAMLGVADVHLVESDVRKATFLREISRETGLPITVHDERVEDTAIENIDIITARALAPLRDLLRMAQGLATVGHPLTCLFLKGEKTPEELEKAKKRFNFNVLEYNSLSDSTGKVLEISALEKK